MNHRLLLNHRLRAAPGRGGYPPGTPPLNRLPHGIADTPRTRFVSGAFRKLELPDKTCPVCGRRFNRRRYGGRLEDRGSYELRKHCSRRCLGIASSREQRSPGRSRG